MIYDCVSIRPQISDNKIYPTCLDKKYQIILELSIVHSLIFDSSLNVL